MHLMDIRKLVLDWGSQYISKDFGEAHMSKDISLLGLDSIDIVEFCKHLEAETGVEVDSDWVLEFQTLNDLANEIKSKLRI